MRAALLASWVGGRSRPSAHFTRISVMQFGYETISFNGGYRRRDRFEDDKFARNQIL